MIVCEVFQRSKIQHLKGQVFFVSWTEENHTRFCGAIKLKPMVLVFGFSED